MKSQRENYAVSSVFLMDTCMPIKIYGVPDENGLKNYKNKTLFCLCYFCLRLLCLKVFLLLKTLRTFPYKIECVVGRWLSMHKHTYEAFGSYSQNSTKAVHGYMVPYVCNLML